MTKRQKRDHAAKVAAGYKAKIRRGKCRQCGRKTAKNAHTGKRYRLCPAHREADAARKRIE